MPFAWILTVGLALSGTVPADPVAASLDVYLDRIASEGASGVALVAVGEEVKLRRGFGHADCAGEQVMTPDHLVLMGSITKELTQLLTYVLVEEEKLAFEDTIGSYFPTLPEPLAAITVRQLVDHTGGLPDLIDAEGEPVPYSVEYDYLPVTRDEMIARAGKSELLFAPGEREEYSNLGYGVLGALLEVASEENYETLLESRIFEPAGMSSTGYVFPDASSRPFAEGCRGEVRWGSPLLDGMWGSEGPSWNLKAAGGLLTTVDDLSSWFSGLGAGLFLGEEMQARYLDERLAQSKLFEQRVMGPAGSNGIFNAVAYWAETSDLRVVVVTTNSTFQAERERIARTLIRTASEYVTRD
jgi:CubicO group peptidase (beta-lactamase class C family)